MDLTTAISQASSLSRDDRIRLVQAIWDGIAAEGAPAPLTVAQREELDRRLTEDDLSPNDVESWGDVKAELKSRPRR